MLQSAAAWNFHPDDLYTFNLVIPDDLCQFSGIIYTVQLWTADQGYVIFHKMLMKSPIGISCTVRCDQQLVEGLRLVVEELVLEEGAFSAPGSEVLDSLHLVHALAGVPKLGPAREVVASRLVGALHAQGELARLGRPLLRAREVADEGFGEVDPAVDAAGLQAVQPCPGRALEHEWNVLHGNSLVAVCYVDVRGVVN